MDTRKSEYGALSELAWTAWTADEKSLDSTYTWSLNDIFLNVERNFMVLGKARRKFPRAPRSSKGSKGQRHTKSLAALAHSKDNIILFWDASLNRGNSKCVDNAQR